MARPGAWLRLTALGASAATLLAVVSGSLGLDTAHRLLAALALPPLAALVAAAWVAHRRLLPFALAALVTFGAAAAVTLRPLHVALAAAAFAATLVATAATYRGAPSPSGPWRDYVTLTKPRIMTLLLLTGAGGMFVGAGGLPSLPKLGVAAALLFAIVFFWTPPHFWALALLIKQDYAAARVPMLPVVRGDRETARQIVLYSLVLVAVTVAPFAWGTLGIAYLVAALALGAIFLALAWQLRRDTTPARAKVLFHYSLLYLALLFVAMAIDPFVA